MSDETKFPEKDSDDRTGSLYYKDYEEIDDWIQRCIKERPSIKRAYKSKFTRGMTGDELMDRYPTHPTHREWVKWFTKWFSQFTPKDDIK